MRGSKSFSDLVPGNVQGMKHPDFSPSLGFHVSLPGQVFRAPPADFSPFTGGVHGPVREGASPVACLKVSGVFPLSTFHHLSLIFICAVV